MSQNSLQKKMALGTCVIPALIRFAELGELLKLLNMYCLKEGYSIVSTLGYHNACWHESRTRRTDVCNHQKFPIFE